MKQIIFTILLFIAFQANADPQAIFQARMQQSAVRYNSTFGEKYNTKIVVNINHNLNYDNVSHVHNVHNIQHTYNTPKAYHSNITTHGCYPRPPYGYYNYGYGYRRYHNSSLYISFRLKSNHYYRSRYRPCW